MRVISWCCLMMLLASGVSASPLSGKVVVLQASSLSEFFKRAQGAFEKIHPEVKIQRETGASMVLVRQITDLSKEADIIAVADRSLIQTFLYPKYVDHPVDFLREEMSLIAADNAKYADQINGTNWFDILLKPDVEFGISDPEKAPAGYRSLLVWQLAEKYYAKPGLVHKLLERLPAKNIRPNAAALMTLLKTGELDYIFDYPSLAKQQGLRAIPLPPQINLGDPQNADLYKTVSVKIPGDNPGTTQTIFGSPIVYSIGLLKAAPNATAARAFLDFLLGPQGKAILQDLGWKPIDQEHRNTK